MATKVEYEGTRELRWFEVGSALVTYMEADIEFDDRLWDDWMEAMERPSVDSLVIGSWGPTQPSHQQWRRATRLMRDKQMRVAVVTDARHNFALAKAASWLGTNVEAFRWVQLGHALDYVGFEDAGKIMAQARVVALRDRYGAVVEDAELRVQAEPMFKAPRVEERSEDYFSASSEVVYDTNDEIQRKLAEIQLRLASRARS